MVDDAKNNKKKSNRGRKTLYDPAFCTVAKNLLSIGQTMEQLAAAIGVDRITVLRWRTKHVEFRNAVQEGRDACDKELVEGSLLDQALGNKYIEKEKVVVVDGVVEKHTIREQVPASVNAATWWLKNRDPARWRDKQEVEHSGGMTLEQLIMQASSEEEEGKNDNI